MILLPTTWEKSIVTNNEKREQLTFSPYACPSSAAQRLQTEPIPDSENIRPAYFHDTDRIIHSLAYSRYIDKTQVFFLFENDHITHRVLHVQLVSKIARTIGRFLRLNEDLIEAIALGHDIGHTPFGHDGERYLNEICEEQEIGYFRHNAQSVRCLQELEKGGEGLNLTLQVLDGILCHNGEAISERYIPAPRKTFEDFQLEYKKLWTERDFGKGLKPYTLEGCVVRISDVIAYIGRDIEDAITVKLITRDQLPERVVRVLGNTNREIIDRLVRDLVQHSLGQPFLVFSPEIVAALHALRDFNYQHIYLSPLKQSQDTKIRAMFRQMFSTLLQQVKENDTSSPIFHDFLDGMSPKYKENTPPARMVADYIAGMTDDYFMDTYTSLFLPRKFGRQIT